MVMFSVVAEVDPICGTTRGLGLSGSEISSGFIFELRFVILVDDVGALGTSDVCSNIVSVTKAAGEAGKSAGEVLEASNRLFQQSDTLGHQVEGFLKKIRAAQSGRIGTRRGRRRVSCAARSAIRYGSGLLRPNTRGADNASSVVCRTEPRNSGGNT